MELTAWVGDNWHIVAGVVIPTLIAFAVGIQIGRILDQ